MSSEGFKNKVERLKAFIVRTAGAVWEYLKAAKMEWIVLVSVFAFDLISKAIVEAATDFQQTVTVIPYFLNIHHIHNDAAAFGSDWMRNMLTDVGARIFFSVFAVATSVAFILVLIKNKGKSRWFRVSIALFVAGALGNCMDRMFIGYVRDFIEIVYFGLTIFGKKSFYIFNIADVALVAGVIMMVIYFVFFYKDPKKKGEQLSPDSMADNEPVDTSASDQPAETGECIAEVTDEQPDTDEQHDDEQPDEQHDGEPQEQTEAGEQA